MGRLLANQQQPGHVVGREVRTSVWLHVDTLQRAVCGYGAVQSHAAIRMAVVSGRSL